MHIDKNPKKLILVHVDTRHALERQRDELSLRTEPALTSDFLLLAALATNRLRGWKRGTNKAKLYETFGRRECLDLYFTHFVAYDFAS